MVKAIFVTLSVFVIITNLSNLNNIDKQNDEIINTNGKELTVRFGCTLCHNPTKKIVGPSFRDIAKAYAGDQEKLLKFLNGQGKPIVDPEEFEFMKPVLGQLKHKTDGEKKALVAYILSLKE